IGSAPRDEKENLDDTPSYASSGPLPSLAGKPNRFASAGVFHHGRLLKRCGSNCRWAVCSGIFVLRHSIANRAFLSILGLSSRIPNGQSRATDWWGIEIGRAHV